MNQHLTTLRTDVRQFDPDVEQVRVHFQAAEDGFATLVVFSPQGGWILSLGEIRVRAGGNTIVWHGHDSEGWPLADGQYSLELFGFDLDRRPSGDAPLRLQIVLARRRPAIAGHGESGPRGLFWFADTFLGRHADSTMEEMIRADG